jgi:hypothetical protein
MALRRIGVWNLECTYAYHYVTTYSMIRGVPSSLFHTPHFKSEFCILNLTLPVEDGPVQTCLLSPISVPIATQQATTQEKFIEMVNQQERRINVHDGCI